MHKKVGIDSTIGKEMNLIMASITKDMIVADVLDKDPTTAEYFFEIGMHCLGCPSSRGETLEQACEVHGVDIDEFLEKLNNHVEK